MWGGFEITFKRMICIFLWQGVTTGKQGDNSFEFVAVFAPLYHQSIFLAETVPSDYGAHSASKWSKSSSTESNRCNPSPAADAARASRVSSFGSKS
jgi:hypothetical protein